MTKKEFCKELHRKLNFIPEKERRETEEYYSEMIDDKIEDGLSEKEAVAEVGAIDDIVSGIMAEAPERKKKISVLTVILLILSAPIWLPVAISLAAVALTLFVLMWVVVIALYSVPVSLVAGTLYGAVMSVVNFILGKPYIGTFCIASVFVCAGLSVIFFVLCNYLALIAVKLTQFIFGGWRKKK